MGYKNPSHNNMENRRKSILKKRGTKCERCGYEGYVEIHHILPVSEGGLDHDENLIVLCEVCHKKAHGHKVKKYLDKNRKYWKPEAVNGK